MDNNEKILDVTEVRIGIFILFEVFILWNSMESTAGVRDRVKRRTSSECMMGRIVGLQTLPVVNQRRLSVTSAKLLLLLLLLVLLSAASQVSCLSLRHSTPTEEQTVRFVKAL